MENLPSYVPVVNNRYSFDSLSLSQLKECWIACEKQKMACHPDSGFQPLIDRDMREIAKLIKVRRNGLH